MRDQLQMTIVFILCSLVGLGYLAFTQETRVRIPAKEVFDGSVIIKISLLFDAPSENRIRTTRLEGGSHGH